MSDISIIIPCYNEEDNIKNVITSILEDTFLKECEIIAIDDCSSDKTNEILNQFKSIKIIRHHHNFGYGQSIITGMKNSSKSNVVWMDGDGQHQVDDVVKLSKILINEDVDYVVGERDSKSFQVKSRILGKFILRILIKFCGIKFIKDFNSGLRGFKTKIIKKYYHLLVGGFGASTTTTMLMEMKNYNGKTCKINVLNRKGISSVNQFRDGFRTILLILRMLLLFKPMKFFLVIGVAFLMSGLTYGFWEVITVGTGFPVFGAVLVLSGIVTIMLGLITDQISQLRLEKFE
jgi:glycosyltransferase involved in cell wall biosynthesis